VHAREPHEPELMNRTEMEDITREKLSWLIAHVDEMFLDLEGFENET
jgi:hypothetical protein